ncbi:DUF502 domain-containing protein [Colwellia echini]|uniref:DUF502 domain-containing protein n=1 Tax=Colwellia echini TaxID=1982103 RepID=A0ABY3MX28_9GAMM|nr:DUF502 domain-containing protein [Colwellia echini]TYK65729.1 DUF502 domain-containing protein [Colwellia echini]
MSTRITMLIMQGLLALLPISLTLYLIIWLVSSIESSLTALIPNSIYFPGLGLVLGFAILLLAGLAVNAYIVKSLIRVSGKMLERIPVVKTIYGAIQDAVNLVNINKQQKMKSVVSVKISDSIHLIGFVTSYESAQTLFNNDEKLGVYVPLSYQIGGYTLYIDKDQLTPLDISVETAMRIALTGGSVPASSANENKMADS